MKKARTIKKDAAQKAEQKANSENQAVTQVQGEAESQDTAALNAVEQMKLDEFEKHIRNCIGDYDILGRAFKVIRDERLYREKYDNFDAYCDEQWGLSGKYAYRLIQAFEVSDALRKDKDIDKQNLPMNESQVRPLLKLPADKRSEAWKQAVKNAEGRKVTALVVKKVVDADLGNKEAKTKSNPTKQKLKKIGGLVKKALDESAKLTPDQVKEILEEIQELLAKKN